ncbi:MAG: AmmeMemoRadiSam system protein B [Campylobacterota bacterium]|nr:AmmeMemoRadiSam system protein B [Campylobacterota bacterium]
MSSRKTAVAGQFYPSNPSEIEAMFSQYNKIIDESLHGDTEILNLKTRAIIVPHAGYVYSGFTANIAFRLLADSKIKRIVVIGPSHRVSFKGISIGEYDNYDTPLGTLPIDKNLVSELKNKFGLVFIPEVHCEHSTEVQMPFIKTYLPNASVVELVYGDENPSNLSEVIQYLLKDVTTAVVISTDLSHFYDIDKANTLDTICIEAIKKLDVNRLSLGCEACGKIGIEAMLISAKKNCLRPMVLDYRTSADASEDKSQVVGYMSAVFL